MKHFPILHVAALSLLLPFTASQGLAEGWSVYDLGEMADRETCKSKARNVINSYIFKYGGGNTSEASWSVYGYDLEPGDQDAVIMCPWVPGGGVMAILNVHGETSDEQRIFTADTIDLFWNK
ncbi:MAG: hypothetical protein GY945_04680 [Rhodobacteraceae bacterium]|nr:hypothetical protein [Paracoccaceae bacterium]